MDEPAAASGHLAHKPHAAATPPRAATAASQHRGKGGGNHISALRSLGLLHELQEYVAACVETQQQQEKELGKLKAEKKDIEKALKQKASRSPEKQPCLQQFQASEISDLPPRIRALFEDNKVLKEQARRYKQRLHEAERSAAGLEQQLLAAQSANIKLKTQLQDGDAGSEAAEELAQARQQAEGLAKALEKLQHANQVLQQKLDTDGRLHRQAQASATKERLQLEEQVQELQEQLEAKEKEARGHALTAKLAQRKLEEVKASAAKAVAGVNARVAEAVAAVEARHKTQVDARVHLMLCIVRDPVEAARQALGKQQPAPQLEAASRAAGNIWSEDSSVGVSQHAVSSSYYGSLSRDEAVLRLQAGARGYLARKHVRLQRQQQADAMVLVQAGQQQQQQQQPQGAATIVQATPAPSSCFPMELPGLDPTPAGIQSQHSASSTPAATAAAAAAAAAGAAESGKHAQPSRVSTPPAGKPLVPAPRPVVPPAAKQPQPAPAAASQGRAASRKPSLPVFSRAPPTPVLNARAPRPDSAAVGGVGPQVGPGAGSRAAVAAGPSILASPGPGSRTASPAPPVVARVASSSSRRGRAGLAAAGSILAAATAPGAGGVDQAGAGMVQGGQRPGSSHSRSSSRSPSVSGEQQAGGGVSPQRQSSGGGSSSHASLPLQRTNSAGSRGVAALAVPPVGTTAAASPGMQRTNSGSSQRSAGSSPALPAVGKPLQQAGSKAVARLGSAVSRSGAAGRKAAQLPNKQQLPAAAQPKPPVQRQPEGAAAAVSPRRASARLSKAPRA